MSDRGTVEQLDETSASRARPKKELSDVKLAFFIVLPLLLLFGGGFASYFTGVLDPLLANRERTALLSGKDVVSGPTTVFYRLPEMLINLNSEGLRRTNYLKLTLSLELADEDGVRELEEVMPRIVDNFQTYLRELRVEDLQGSAGLQRLREELLLRVNAATRRTEVLDVLFTEMLVQ